MNNLALAYGAAGRLTDALALHEETLKRRQAKLGPDHSDTLTAMNNLAVAYRAAGRLADALSLHEETLKRRQAKLGLDHPDTLTSMSDLAQAYRAAGRLADALPLFEKALKGFKAKLGPDHPNTLIAMNNLARAYLAGKPAQAEPLARSSGDMWEKDTGRLVRFRNPQPARWQPARPEEIRRGRAAPAPRLRGDEGSRSQDPGSVEEIHGRGRRRGSSSFTGPGAKRRSPRNGGGNWARRRGSTRRRNRDALEPP